MSSAEEIAETPSFDETFRAQAPFVWRVLRRLGIRDADVDDVFQEVFLVVHRRYASFHSGSSMRTWIYGICVRVASEHRRRPYVRREAPSSDTLPEPRVEPSQDEHVDRRRALSRFDGVLDQLDDDKRAVFVLFEIEGMTMHEVAAAVGCPLQTAYARLYAARKVVVAAFPSSPEEPRVARAASHRRSAS
jgi:RNA polymerase sigma-70 factor, ECF subfamily